MLDLALGEPDGGGIVDLHGGGRLGVTTFIEGDAYGARFAGGHEGGAYLCFHIRAHDGGDDFGKDVDWAIGIWIFCWFLVRVVAFVVEEEPSACLAAGFRFGQVQRVAGRPQDHAAFDMCEFCFWEGGAIVK